MALPHIIKPQKHTKLWSPARGSESLTWIVWANRQQRSEVRRQTRGRWHLSPNPTGLEFKNPSKCSTTLWAPRRLTVANGTTGVHLMSLWPSAKVVRPPSLRDQGTQPEGDTQQRLLAKRPSTLRHVSEIVSLCDQQRLNRQRPPHLVRESLLKPVQHFRRLN